MENQEKLLQQVAQPQAVPNLSQLQSSQAQPKPSDRADDALLVEAINRLQIAFPDNSREFYKLLFSRLKEANMSRFMLVRKVNKVIDTYQYAKLTIGAVINIDINK